MFEADVEYCSLCPDQWSRQGRTKLKADGAWVVGCMMVSTSDNTGGWVSQGLALSIDPYV